MTVTEHRPPAPPPTPAAPGLGPLVMIDGPSFADAFGRLRAAGAASPPGRSGRARGPRQGRRHAGGRPGPDHRTEMASRAGPSPNSSHRRESCP